MTLGARVAASPAEAALDREVVLVVVVDALQVDAVLFDGKRPANPS